MRLYNGIPLVQIMASSLLSVTPLAESMFVFNSQVDP